MKKEIRKNNMKNIRKKIIKKAKGITLISLVITIIILLILAGVTLSLTLGDNGIITQAEKAKEAQEIAAIKEDFQLAILDKELEKGGTGLTQEELEEIAGNYGELQEDGNTIKTDEGYEIKIDEIYNQEGGITGGDAATDEELAELQQKVEELEKTVEDLNNTKTELEGTIEDLNNQIEQEQGNSAALQEQVDNLTQQVDNLNKTIEQQQNTINDLNTQIADLQKKQSTGNATVADVLEGKTFSNGTQIGLTGTIKNRGTLNWSGSNTTYNIPAGYYSGGTLDSRPSYNNGYNAGVTAADNRANPNSTNYQTGYNAGYGAGNSAGYNNGYNAGVAAGTNASGLKTKTGSVGTTSSGGWNMTFWGRNEIWDCTVINISPGFTPYMAVAIADTYRHISVYSRDAGFVWMYHRDAANSDGAVYRFTAKSATSSSLQMPVASDGYTYQYWVVGK